MKDPTPFVQDDEPHPSPPLPNDADPTLTCARLLRSHTGYHILACGHVVHSTSTLSCGSTCLGMTPLTVTPTATTILDTGIAAPPPSCFHWFCADCRRGKDKLFHTQYRLTAKHARPVRGTERVRIMSGLPGWVLELAPQPAISRMVLPATETGCSSSSGFQLPLTLRSQERSFPTSVKHDSHEQVSLQCGGLSDADIADLFGEEEDDHDAGIDVEMSGTV